MEQPPKRTKPHNNVDLYLQVITARSPLFWQKKKKQVSLNSAFNVSAFLFRVVDYDTDSTVQPWMRKSVSRGAHIHGSASCSSVQSERLEFPADPRSVSQEAADKFGWKAWSARRHAASRGSSPLRAILNHSGPREQSGCCWAVFFFTHSHCLSWNTHIQSFLSVSGRIDHAAELFSWCCLVLSHVQK